jgi:hypothetical protein
MAKAVVMAMYKKVSKEAIVAIEALPGDISAPRHSA